MKRSKNAKYFIISHKPMNGFSTINVPPDVDPDEYFISNSSSFYSSIMFQTNNGGAEWTIYKKQGWGKLDQILKNQSKYLPKPK